MEVKINKEIADYTEAVYFGLSLRQFIFAALSCGTAVGVYFLLRNHVDGGIATVLCTVAAAPFAALGFFKWHGLPAEKVAIAWLKSEILMPKELKYKATSIYDETTIAEERSKNNVWKRKKK